MPLWNRSSDRMQERVWHVVAAMAMAAAGWLLVIYFPAPELRLVGLIFTVSGGFCAMSTFWTLPQSLLSEAARPAGIGLISAVGLLGSAVSPAVIGFLRDAHRQFLRRLVLRHGAAGGFDRAGADRVAASSTACLNR